MRFAVFLCLLALLAAVDGGRRKRSSKGEAPRPQKCICDRLKDIDYESYCKYGNSARKAGKKGCAKTCFKAATEINEKKSYAWYEWGDLVENEGDVTKATTLYKKALKHHEDSRSHAALGRIAGSKGRQDECVKELTTAVEIDELPIYHHWLAKCYFAMNPPDTHMAMTHAIRATNVLTLDDRDETKAQLFNYASFIATHLLGQEELAIGTANASVTFGPTNGVNWAALANAFASASRRGVIAPEGEDYVSAAVEAYQRAIELDPSSLTTVVGQFYFCRELCEWSNFTERGQAVVSSLKEHMTNNLAIFLPPDVANLALPRESLHEWYSHDAAKRALASSGSSRSTLKNAWTRPSPEGKITLGYLAALDGDVHDSALPVDCLLHFHDSDKFDVIVFHFGESEKDAAALGVTDVVSVVNLSSEQVAFEISRRRVGILVNAYDVSHKKAADVLMYRPAPVQISLSSFVSTGSSAVQYLVTDPVLSAALTPEVRVEKLLQLPSLAAICHLEGEGGLPGRRETQRGIRGISPDAFVFAYFDHLRKITPDTLDLWARILTRVPASVLWLLALPAAAADRLLSEFEARGVGPERITFSPAETPRGRLAPLADLHLDVVGEGSLGLAGEVLYFGTPIAALATGSAVERTTAAAVNAAGLGGLVANDVEEYENIAVSFAQDSSSMERFRTAEGVTGEQWIEYFEHGILVASAQQTPADIIVDE